MTERDGPALHGWLIIDKPVGPGSTQIVSAAKRALRLGGYAKVKVGHGGTLDPLASGVLPIALGEATKLSGRMLDADKIYAFTIAFGAETDTLDTEGVVVETSPVRPTRAALEAVLPRFTGPIEQVPPAYSALKIDGQRAYDLARAGQAPEMKARAVTIHALALSPPFASSGGSSEVETRSREGDATCFSTGSKQASRQARSERGGLDAATLVAHVSKGTYIRSLARDIARALGTVGHVTMLRRLKAGPFTLEGAIPLDMLADLGQGRALETTLLPLAAGLDDIPALSVTPDQARLLRQGRKVIGIAASNGLHLAISEDAPVALVIAEDGEVRVERGFNL